MNIIIQFNDSYLEYRNTPWDQKVFNRETKEILYIHYSNPYDIKKLIESFEDKCSIDSLIYFRVSSNDQKIKKVLFEQDYYIAESSLHLINTKIQKMDFSKIYKTRIKLSSEITNEHIKEIKDIAKTAFKFSRFHEDPFLDHKLANKRYTRWIDDLIMQNKEIIVYKDSENKVISFMFYDITNNKAKLILGGSKNNYGIITPSFFSAIMSYLQSRDIKKIDVIISNSNIVIFNIYITLGFTIKDTMFDYHKSIN